MSGLIFTIIIILLVALFVWWLGQPIEKFINYPRPYYSSVPAYWNQATNDWKLYKPKCYHDHGHKVCKHSHNHQ